MNYEETLEYIHSLGKFPKGTTSPALDRMSYLCGLLGDPQEDIPAIHIAGTNGKGSMAAYCSEILRCAGYRAGRYISPYIEDFRERISINGENISKSDLVECCEEVISVLPKLEQAGYGTPVEFEFITAAAFLYYKRMNCDFMVLEVGLGGRLDATNLIKKPLVSVIMSIDYDHTKILGDTLDKISAEKCGIIKHGCPVVSYPLQDASAAQTICMTAEKRGCMMITPSTDNVQVINRSLDGTEIEYNNANYLIGLLGWHQVYNAITAVEVMNVLKDIHKINIPESAIANGLAQTHFPARFEVVSKNPLIVVDGAHNVSGVETLCESMRLLMSKYKIHIVFGCMTDKEPEKLIARYQECSETAHISFTVVDVNVPRACPKEKLYEYASELCKESAKINIGNSISEVLDSCKNLPSDEALVCFGSLYLAGEFRAACRKIFLIP